MMGSPCLPDPSLRGRLPACTPLQPPVSLKRESVYVSTHSAERQTDGWALGPASCPALPSLPQPPAAPRSWPSRDIGRVALPVHSEHSSTSSFREMNLGTLEHCNGADESDI